MSVHESNREQAEFWEQAGPMWARQRARFDRQVGGFGDHGIDALDPQPGESVVDVGCGTGTSTLQIAERVGSTGSVAGSDISPTMIDAARARLADTQLSNVTFEVADAHTADFDGAADALFSPFGVMFFADPMDNPWLSGAMATIREYVDLPLGRDPHAPGPLAFADRDRVLGILGDAGFSDARATPVERMVTVGEDLADATDFIFELTPPLRALDADDPSRASTIREAIADTYRPHRNDSGSVLAPGAVWVMAATRPL